MPRARIKELDVDNAHSVDACAEFLVGVFDQPERYSFERLTAELQSAQGLFYRKFFVASDGDEIVGFGGVKAADWASHTHVLYLSAVAPGYRGHGIGRALLNTRVEWVEENFKMGRILVSSARAKRFQDLGFSPIARSGMEGRHLMMRRF